MGIFSALFGADFAPAKCKTSLRLCLGRVKLLKNKKRVALQALSKLLKFSGLGGERLFLAEGLLTTRLELGLRLPPLLDLIGLQDHPPLWHGGAATDEQAHTE